VKLNFDWCEVFHEMHTANNLNHKIAIATGKMAAGEKV
jgi:hypothetical protein